MGRISDFPIDLYMGLTTAAKVKWTRLLCFSAGTSRFSLQANCNQEHCRILKHVQFDLVWWYLKCSRFCICILMILCTTNLSKLFKMWFVSSPTGHAQQMHIACTRSRSLCVCVFSRSALNQSRIIHDVTLVCSLVQRTPVQIFHRVGRNQKRSL